MTVGPTAGASAQTGTDAPPRASVTPAPRAPWTLRRRLVVTVVAMLALVSTVVGVVSVIALQSFLTDRLDSQVEQAANRGFGGPGGQDDLESGSSVYSYLCRGGGGPGDVSGTLIAVLGSSIALSCYTDADGEVQALTAAQLAALAAVPSTSSSVRASEADVRTVDLGAGLGAYRVIAQEAGEITVYTALPLKSVTDTVTQLVIVILVVTVIGMIAIALAAAGLVRLALRPLDRVESTATRVAQLQLERGEVDLAERVPDADTDVRTEVGRVGAAFNTMLDHVGSALAARQASENKVRQFVADASHELRTPLAAIRGYAELPRRAGAAAAADEADAAHAALAEAARRAGVTDFTAFAAEAGAGAVGGAASASVTPASVTAGSDQSVADSSGSSGSTLSADAAYSLERIEAAATRMTSLVEDLLLLARLDEGRDLERTEVDLTMVLIEALSDAHAAGPEHDWDLDLPEEPIEVVGDALRIHQVVANLLTNARVHTPAGTRVVASLERGTDARGRAAAIVTIADEGPGIQPDLVPVLFERFARGDASRARATGSTGLGLAIVAAVVEAHDGTVTVESEPGRTAFRVTLPVA